jgi:hypothetical protein
MKKKKIKKENKRNSPDIPFRIMKQVKKILFAIINEKK